MSLFFLAFARPRLIGEQSWPHIRSSGALRVGIDPGWRPFSFYSESGWQGLDADLAHELAQRLGLTLSLDPVGYDGLYDALATRRTDIALSAVVMDGARTEDFAYSQPYFDAGLRLVAPISATLTGTHDLAGKRVAVALGSEADREARYLERRVPGLSRVTVADETWVTDAIRIGIADVGIVTADAALKIGCADKGELTSRTTRKTIGSEAELAPVWRCAVLQPVPFAIAVRKEDTRLLEEINQALNEMKVDGAWDKLVEKWFRAP